MVPDARRPVEGAPLLVLHASDELYGADRVLLTVLDALRDGWTPIVVLPDDVPEGTLTTALVKRGIEVRREALPVLRRRYLSPAGMVLLSVRGASAFLALVRLGRRRRVAAVHSNTAAVLVGPFVGLALRRPHVWHIHEIIDRPRWLGRLLAAITRLPGQRVVVVSEAAAMHLRQHGGRVDQVLRNPAPSVGDVRPMPTNGPPVVVMAGRVNGRKGHDVFVRSAVIAHEARPDAVFDLIGGPVPGQPEAHDALVDLVRRTDDSATWLRFHGWTDDLPERLAGAAVVVLPTTGSEALNITALEAMALGRPVIASRTGGLVEVVEHGVTGLLVAPGDEQALAVSILTILADPELAQAMGSAGRRRAVEQFGVEAYRRSWIDLYDRVRDSSRR